MSQHDDSVPPSSGDVDDGLIEQAPLPVGTGAARMGRPSKIDPAVTTRIAQMVAAGNTIETACAFVDISRTTMRAWLKRGRKQRRGQYRDFLTAMERAMAQAELLHVTNITSIARGTKAQYDAEGREVQPARAGQWTASAWFLERRNPKRWGRKDQHRMADADGGKLRDAVFVLDMGRTPAATDTTDEREEAA